MTKKVLGSYQKVFVLSLMLPISIIIIYIIYIIVVSREKSKKELGRERDPSRLSIKSFSFRKIQCTWDFPEKLFSNFLVP